MGMLRKIHFAHWRMYLLISMLASFMGNRSKVLCSSVSETHQRPLFSMHN